MIAHLLDLLRRVGKINWDIRRSAAMRIEPKLIPDHDAILIAGVVEGLVRSHSHPVANNIEIHLLVKAEPSVVVSAVAAEDELGHAPTSPLKKERHSVDSEMENTILLGVGVLLDAKGDLLAVGNLLAGLKLQGAGVEVGVAIAVGPPEPRMGNTQRAIFRRREFDGLRLIGR